MPGDFMGVFTIGQTLDRGFRLYRKTLKTLLLLFLPPGLILTLSLTGMVIGAEMEYPILTGISGISNLFSLVFIAYIGIISIRYLHQVSEGHSPLLGDILRFSGPKDLLYLLTLLLWMAVAMLTMLALLVPYIWFANLSYLGIVIAIVEKRYGFSSIKRTIELTRKRWWKTFAINLILGLMVAVPMYGVMILASGVLPIFAADVNEQSMANVVAAIVGLMLVSAIVFIVITPLYYTTLVVHYNSLRSEKESADLDKQLDELAVSPN